MFDERLQTLDNLAKQGDFETLNATLNEFEQNQSLLPLVTYYRGYMAEVGLNRDINKEEAMALYQQSLDMGNYAPSAYRLSKLYDDGSVKKDNIERSNSYLLISANGNYPEAMNDLGVYYLSGRGSLRQDIPAAIDLWKKCTKAGYVLGDINYSNYLVYNSENPKEISGALLALAKYAEANIKEALYFYALILINGVKTERNPQLGFAYMKKAASLNYVKAIIFLADALYNGNMVHVDHKNALYYYQKAAQLKDLDATMFCAYAYLVGDGVEKNLQKSLDYCYIAAKGGRPDAQIALGDRYYYGDSVKQNFHIALHWYNEASKEGSAYAYERLADMLLDGQGVKKDNKKALEYYKKALELGDKDVYLALGKIYQNGLGVKRDKNKAIEYYLLGYKRHNPYAAYYYAELAVSGRINGIKDYQNAAPAYELAATADIPEACKKAGECYLKGLGVGRDLEKALNYYLKASLLGDNESTIMVNIIKKQIDLNNI